MDDSPGPEEEWTERGRTAGAESPDPADSTGWGKTLELAHQAASTLVFTQDRLAELEAEKRELEARLASEVESMQARIRASERLLERLEGIKTAVEKRAEIAEQRAQVAEKRLSEIGARIRQLRAS